MKKHTLSVQNSYVVETIVTIDVPDDASSTDLESLAIAAANGVCDNILEAEWQSISIVDTDNQKEVFSA